MKKLLSLLASIGLIVTGGSTIVACGVGNNKNKKVIDITVAPEGKDFIIKSTSSVELDLIKPAASEIPVTSLIPNDFFGHLVFANEKGKKFILNKGSKADVKAWTYKKMKKGDTKADIMFSITVNDTTLKSTGLLKPDGTIGKDIDVKLGKANSEGNLSLEICSFHLSARSFISVLNEPTISGQATVVSNDQFDVNAEFIPEKLILDNTSISIKNVDDPADNVSWSTWPLLAKISDNVLRVSLGYGKLMPESGTKEQKFIVTIEGFKGSAELIIPAAK